MANRITLKFRSVTYPNQEQSSQTRKMSRGKLKRMDSVDLDERDIDCQSNLVTQNNQQLMPPSVVHGSRSAMIRRRDLSLEGRLRVNHFQHTHSASSALAPGKKLLRFSDGGLGKSGAALQSGLNCQVRSSSCLPLSKQRGSLSPRTSNLHLERPCDCQKSSIDRPSLSPNRSQDRPESGVTKSRSNRRLERFFSTDVPQNSSRSSANVIPEPSSSNNNEAAAGTSGSDTRSRRSQFRRAFSLFSLNCDKETERERREKTSQKILRPPTRHIYRRGLSGLPIECTSRSLGVVY